MSNPDTPEAQPSVPEEVADAATRGGEIARESNEQTREELDSLKQDFLETVDEAAEHDLIEERWDVIEGKLEDFDLTTEELTEIETLLIDQLESDEIQRAKELMKEFIDGLEGERVAVAEAAGESSLVHRAFGPLVRRIETTQAGTVTVDEFVNNLAQEPLILQAYQQTAARTSAMAEVKLRLERVDGNDEELKREMLVILTELAADNEALVDEIEPYAGEGKLQEIGSGLAEKLEAAGVGAGMIASLIKMIVDGIQNAFPNLDLSSLDDLRYPYVAKDYRENVIPQVFDNYEASWELSDEEIISLAKNWEAIPDKVEIAGANGEVTTVDNHEKPRDFAEYLDRIVAPYYQTAEGGTATEPLTPPTRWSYADITQAEARYLNDLENQPEESEAERISLNEYVTQTSLEELIQAAHETTDNEESFREDIMDTLSDEAVDEVTSTAAEFHEGFGRIIIRKKLGIDDENVEINVTASNGITIEQRAIKMVIHKNMEGETWTLTNNNIQENNLTEAAVINRVSEILEEIIEDTEDT